MHPEYVDYVPKQYIKMHDGWYKVKFLIRKLLGCSKEDFYVYEVKTSNWYGWLVEFREKEDLQRLKDRIGSVTIVAERAIFIGVFHG